MLLSMRRHSGALVAAGLFLAACSAWTEPAASRSSGELVVLSRAEEPSAFMDALFVGKVSADSRGCLRLDDPDQHTVIWPRGFDVVQRGASWVVVDAAGRDVGTLGGSFRLGGGEVTQVPADMLSPADAQLAAETCPGRYWLAWIPVF